MFAVASPCAWRTPIAARRHYVVIATFVAGVVCHNAARSNAALTPESPEVVAMVDKALKFLETTSDERLGGKCLIALAFHKAGRSIDHPKIVEAIEACRTSLEAERRIDYIYGKALAVIFLAELNSPTHRQLLEQYAGLLPAHR
jgi:hypothetical protein